MAEPIAGSVSSASVLPPRPSLPFLRKLAKDRLHADRTARPEARLYESQLLVAREHGFRSWRHLVEELNAGTRGNVRREGGRVEIEGVAPLAWSGSDNTYLQSLATVLRVIGPPHDYVRLFGDSGLAFRLRFWANDGMTAGCPSSPGGEFPPWTDMAERSIGWDMRWEVRLNGTPDDPNDMSDLLDEVTASIDAGLPLLAYAKSWDMGIVYGYEGTRLLARDFYVGNTETLVDITETRGLFGFFEQRAPVPPPLESARLALAEGVSRWSHAPDRRARDGDEGAYYYGEEAYARWTRLLERAGELTGDQQRALLHVSYWTYISLHDARQKAAPYLRSLAEVFDPPAAGPLSEAAAAYQEAGEITGQVIHEGRLFPAFYMPNALDRWTPEVRAGEIELLNRVLELDRRAIAALRRVA